ncbi:hypothetical protein CY35_07G073000 [Sphagnum magellanicum]|uniref:Uncharacterized protein n=1 Tax=Sphagnum magellanicum TaxID=128215 RepID=A0ACB8HM02_9BRYO|nr:hypothetical protein CY35_07G073000 [Sphagnum magellanicum]
MILFWGDVVSPLLVYTVLSLTVIITRLYVSIVPTEYTSEMFQGLWWWQGCSAICFRPFDMKPKNTNMVTGMVQALAQLVMRVQMLYQWGCRDTSGCCWNGQPKGTRWRLQFPMCLNCL